MQICEVGAYRCIHGIWLYVNTHTTNTFLILFTRAGCQVVLQMAQWHLHWFQICQVPWPGDFQEPLRCTRQWLDDLWGIALEAALRCLCASRRKSTFGPCGHQTLGQTRCRRGELWRGYSFFEGERTHCMWDRLFSTNKLQPKYLMEVRSAVRWSKNI